MLIFVALLKDICGYELKAATWPLFSYVLVYAILGTFIGFNMNVLKALSRRAINSKINLPEYKLGRQLF